MSVETSIQEQQHTDVHAHDHDHAHHEHHQSFITKYIFLPITR